MLSRDIRIVALAIGMVACGGESSPIGPSASEVAFSGRVLDYVTQSPAAGATVSFEPGTGQAITNADGSYTLTVPHTGSFRVSINGRSVGTAFVNGRAYRGDFFTHAGTCASRYGLILSDRTLRPVTGALVTIGNRNTTTDADGWYRLDFSCPDVIRPGNTTFLTVTHPTYASKSAAVGRGVVGVLRLDVTLARR